MQLTPRELAAALLAEYGLPKTWHRVSWEGIDAKMRHDDAARSYWKAVKVELVRLAPRPSPDELDVYRLAKMLIDSYGVAEASKYALHRGIELEEDHIGQAVWIRVYDAIKVMARQKPGTGEWLH